MSATLRMGFACSNLVRANLASIAWQRGRPPPGLTVGPQRPGRPRSQLLDLIERVEPDRRARHRLNPAVDMIEPKQRLDGDVSTSTPQAIH